MSTAVLDSGAPEEIKSALRQHGFLLLLLPPHPNLPPPVAAHPDLLIFFARDAIYTSPLYREIADAELNTLSCLTGRDIRTVSREIGGLYPEDILLDAAQVGNRLFCLPGQTASELIAGMRTVAVKQGYAKCSVLPVGSHALITADPSVSAAASREGLSLLTVRPGNIRLPGYDTGFIGGASSYAPYRKTSEIFFCGKLAQHPDGEAIARFCRAHGRKPIALADIPLTDIGTVFVLP